LDLFCGAGGAAKGYADAGFEVVGVDLAPQPNFPFSFLQTDAPEFLIRTKGEGFDAIHASPPCQAYSTQTQDKTKHRRLIGIVRNLLNLTDLPWVIENVEGAKKELRDPVRLCGSSFGLDVRRHRYFEANWPVEGKPCDHSWQTPRFRSLNITQHRAGILASVVGVHGHLNYPGEFDVRRRAMGIDWMTNEELVEAIPPAYTRFLGEQLASVISQQVAA
jgi:DNA (cytosine-5)-methyltransferase 1